MPSLIDDPPRARSACVVVGATPDAVRSIGDAEADANARFTVRANRLGVLIFGRLGGLPVDLADAFDGPVYDILYNPARPQASATATITISARSTRKWCQAPTGVPVWASRQNQRNETIRSVATDQSSAAAAYAFVAGS